MPAIRVVRTVQAKPGKLKDLMKASFELAQHMEKAYKIRAEIFCNRFSTRSIGGLVIFMDFESLAQYESIFLDSVLRDNDYLRTLESTTDFVQDTPRDEMIVRLNGDDHFMNLA